LERGGPKIVNFSPVWFGVWSGKDEKLEATQVQRIIAALDEKCRDVEF